MNQDEREWARELDTRDRLRTLEVKEQMLEGELQAARIDIDRLMEAANVGRGAWKFVMWLGSVLVVLAGAFAWLWDRIGVKHP